MPPRTVADRDRDLMRIALVMAARGLGTTAPNPSVGAVLVDPVTGEIIARAVTQPGGRPHAETEAIAMAGQRARGATLYVTLEPCSHYGRTPPCADAVVAGRISRVVCGIEDPDPRVAGRGLDRLRAAGIEVVRGVEAEACHRMALGHIVKVTQRRPLVQVKLATAADGSVPRGANGRPVWVTGAEARAHGHLLRARADAILVGSQTVADDNPELTCRLPGLTHRSPVRVVLAGARLPALDSKLVMTAREVPVIIACGHNHDAESVARYNAAGCKILRTVTVSGRPWLPAVCEGLVAFGMTRLLVEGGPTVWAAFLGAGFADEIVHYSAGGSGKDDVLARRARVLGAQAGAFELAESRCIGDDRLDIYWRS
jgi:diaminohydroxyphosphoribosylaminopyrimidine deaminase/5-amino-6-(5-phosphoribosylamino)uracil reductase